MKLNRLKQIRKDKGVTAQKLAELVGVHTVSIYRIEAGARGLSLPLAMAIAQALETTLDELFPAPEEASA